MNKVEEKDDVLENREDKSEKQREKKERKQLGNDGEERRFKAGNFVTDPQTTMGTARV